MSKEMTIPEVRVRLREIADEMAALSTETNMLVEQLIRRRNRTPSKPTHAPATAEVRQAIRVMARLNPALGEHEIGLAFNVNQGRVSEALYGKRGGK